MPSIQYVVIFASFNDRSQTYDVQVVAQAKVLNRYPTKQASPVPNLDRTVEFDLK